MKAPSTDFQIADYECKFNTKQFNNLINVIFRIENKYKIKIRIITAKSFNRLTNEDLHLERLQEIFKVDLVKDSILIFEFSETEKLFNYSSSQNFRKMINEKSIKYKIAKITTKYFDDKKYFQAFKEMLEAIEQELQKNII